VNNWTDDAMQLNESHSRDSVFNYDVIVLFFALLSRKVRKETGPRQFSRTVSGKRRTNSKRVWFPNFRPKSPTVVWGNSVNACDAVATELSKKVGICKFSTQPLQICSCN